MKNRSFYYGGELPLGLSMCMAQYPYAYDCFAKLTNDQRRELIQSAENSGGSVFMHEIADNIIGGKNGRGRSYSIFC